MRDEQTIRQAIQRLEDGLCDASLGEYLKRRDAAIVLRWVLGQGCPDYFFINQYLGVSNSDVDQESVK